MKKVLLALALLAVLILSGCVQYAAPYTPPTQEQVPAGGTTGTVVGPQTQEVLIQNIAFNPAELTIKKGDTVKWINKDPYNHTITSDTGAFESSLLPQNQEFSKTFNETGTFNYHCKIHLSMTAKIIVTE